MEVPFAIGHQFESHTFYPSFLKAPSEKFFYADIAGRLDSNGPEVELINQMILKKIFTLAKKVRFMIPFTLGQMEDQRGNAIREHIMTLLHIFEGDFDRMADSVQPVLTKIRPKEAEFDLK